MIPPKELPVSTPDAVGPAPVPASQRKQSRTLFRAGLMGLAALCAYYGFTASVDDPLHLYLGLAIAVLAVLPSLLWARRARYSLPVFEVFMLTSLNTYAIPLLSGHEQLQAFDPSTLTTAGFMVLVYQLVANITYAAVIARPRRGALWRDEILSKDISRFLGYGLLLSTTYTVVVQFTDWMPREMVGILRAISFGVGNIACFVQGRRWGRGELSSQEKAVFSGLLFAQMFFGAASLLLISAISLLILCLVGYVSGAKKIPVMPIVIALPILAALHNGKAAMREQYWGPGGMNRQSVVLSELPSFYSNWFRHGLQPRADGSSRSTNSRLLERTSLFHVMCLVVSITPERQPHLNGRTYAQVPEQFVPRLFWPDKPPAHISTNTLAIYYGLQNEEDTFRTTIAFGLLTEAYANYGLLGVAALGCLFAAAFKKISGWSLESPILSYPGLFMVVLMAWSFMTEFTLAVWLSSFFQANVVVLGVPFLKRNLFH